MARGYLTMFKITGDVTYKHKAVSCLDWLVKNKAPGFENYSWGKMFDFASRGGRQGKYEPITVWTSLIGQAFLDAYEIIGDNTYLNIADSVCRWIIKRPRNRTESGFCINYTPSGDGDCTIHNQSMLAAAMLARTARFTGNDEFVNVASEAIKYTCTRQLPDGAWLYGEGAKWQWIDNFHTGYNLDALKCYIESTGDKTYGEKLRKGFDFFKANFLSQTEGPNIIMTELTRSTVSVLPKQLKPWQNSPDTMSHPWNWGEELQNGQLKICKTRAVYFYFMRYPYIKLKSTHDTLGAGNDLSRARAFAVQA